MIKTHAIPREVANILNLSVATIQKLVENNMLEAWKTKGGHRRILKKSVVEYASNVKKIELNNLPKFSLLIIEDNVQLTKLYEHKISSWNVELDLKIVNSGIEGFMEIVKNKPDLLILDLKMEGIDGFKVLSLIKNDASLSHIDVIVVTGLLRSELEKQITDKETIILEKPFSFEFLHGYILAKIKHKKDASFFK
ncbi:response regulator [Methylophilus sp. QUAN]|uniref:response regulator n=1 Tax=Methylophilus sp. QUAN TaxID=2781020 RepID=UPI00188FD414|nr:response regulator [Methylophilus sp. QUAN]